jgi:hypothetical protein
MPSRQWQGRPPTARGRLVPSLSCTAATAALCALESDMERTRPTRSAALGAVPWNLSEAPPKTPASLRPALRASFRASYRAYTRHPSRSPTPAPYPYPYPYPTASPNPNPTPNQVPA